MIEPNLRPADLIAKTARVTLKDTLRVILALQAVSHHQGVWIDDLIDTVDFVPSRPSPENIAACEQAAFALQQQGLLGHEITGILSTLKELA